MVSFYKIFGTLNLYGFVLIDVKMPYSKWTSILAYYMPNLANIFGRFSQLLMREKPPEFECDNHSGRKSIIKIIQFNWIANIEKPWKWFEVENDEISIDLIEIEHCSSIISISFINLFASSNYDCMRFNLLRQLLSIRLLTEHYRAHKWTMESVNKSVDKKS